MFFTNSRLMFDEISYVDATIRDWCIADFDLALTCDKCGYSPSISLNGKAETTINKPFLWRNSVSAPFPGTR
jgi:hypothetical protein